MSSAKCKLVADLIRDGKTITMEDADALGVAATYKALLVELGLLTRRNEAEYLRRELNEAKALIEQMKQRIDVLELAAAQGPGL